MNKQSKGARGQGGRSADRASRGRAAGLEQLETRLLLSKAAASVVAGAEQVAPVYQLPQYRLLNQRGSHFLSKPAAGKPLDIALKYLRDNALKLGMQPGDIGNPIVTNQYTDADTGVTHIYLRQQYNGLEIANANLSIHITRDGRVLNVGGGFVPKLSKQMKASAALNGVLPNLAADQALTDAVGGLGLKLKNRPVFKSKPTGKTLRRDSVLQAKEVSLDDVPAKLHYVATADGLKLAWNLVVRTPDGQHWYDVSVDGVAGGVVSSVDWVDHATYNVLPLPTEMPLDGPRQILTDPADPVTSPFGWHDTDGVAGAEFTDTRGNNVSAQDDIDNNNTGGTRADGGASLNFDFPVDLTQSPSAYRAAAITNLFYMNNALHDIHARYGFTEAAGNFQVKNYSGAGLANDAVQADAQDGGGTNNANFGTPPDGQAPRMQMYLFNYTSPGRDGDLDNQIIIHEYGHGVSTRLTGGPANSSSLDAIQSGSMGEGWGDWWGLMLTQKPTDAKTDAYPMGTYVLGQSQTTGVGIRRYPYSFDKTKDPLTYGNFKTNNEVHDGGEIWCAALWDLNWLLIDKYGFSADVAHGYDAATAGRNAGNNLALKLVMDALKLQPANPSMLAARDAILAADQALTGGANVFQIWTAFARRGMGFSAKDGGSGSSTNVTEAFDLPPGLLKPIVTGTLPSTVQTSPVSQVDVNFSKAMNPASFTVADDVSSFVGPDGSSLQGQILGSTWVNASTLRITFFPQNRDGLYTMVLGPNITSADDGSAMDQDLDGTAGEATQDQYTATFRYDSVVLAVTSTTPANTMAVTLPFTTLDVDFNEPVGVGSIGTSDVVLSRGTVTGAAAIDADTVRYTLGGITGETDLTFTMAAGALTDVAGNPSLPYGGSFGVDIGTIPFPSSLTTTYISGAGIHSGTASASLSFPTDADSFTVNVDAGQTISALVDPATTLQAKVEVFDPQGNLLAGASGTAAGKDAYVQSVPAATAGQYKVTVTRLGTAAGTARVEVTLGATYEAEAHDGAVNSPDTSAQALGPAFAPLGTQAGQDRAAVLGTLTSSSDVDWYSVPLLAGESLSAMASGSVSLTLTWAGATGSTTLARSTPYNPLSNGVAAMINDFVAPVDGTYYVGVSGTSALTYALGVTRNAGFEVDPNGATSPVQPTYAKAVNGRMVYTGYLGAGDVDAFQFAVKAGVPFTVGTATPGDGANEPSNPLDPRVQILSGAQVLASDDNSAPDGHNALATYTPTADGVVTVSLTQAMGTFFTGEYTLFVDGGQSAAGAFTGTVITPANNAKVATAPTSVTVDFSDAFKVDSIAAGDLTLDGVAATAFTVVDYNTVTFTVPANTTPGAHALAIAAGAVSDIHGNPIAAMASTYTIDNVGPRIINSTVQENDVRSSGALSLTFTFDEAINPGVLDSSDFALSGQYRVASYFVSSYTLGAGNTTLTLNYTNLPEDHYTLTLISGVSSLVDTSGNAMDGEAVTFPIGPNKSGNGVSGGNFIVHFDLDATTTAYPTALAILSPLGSTVYDASASAVIATAGDTDSYTIALDAGQTLTAILDPATTLQATVSLYDPQGNLMFNGVPSATGKDALIQGRPITTAGTYTLTVAGQAGTTGTYRLELTTNAVAETEAHDGATDDTTATAQNLDAAFTNVFGAAGGDRAAVLGVSTSSTDADFYGVTLAAGDTLTLAAGVQSGSMPLMSLYDPAGALVAYSGLPSGGTNGILVDYVAKSAGTYLFKVTSISATNYLVLAARNAGFDAEANGSFAQAASLQARPAATGERTVVGYTTTSDFDYYRLPVTAGTPVTIKTFTPADGANLPVSLPNPRLRIFNASGLVLASDDNSAPDGRNAVLTYTPTATDTLYVEVVSMSGSGDYTLSVAGAGAPNTPFTASVTQPLNNAKLAIAPSLVVIDFNDSIDLATLSAGDVTIDGIPLTAMTVVDYNTVNFTAPAGLSQGQHTIAIAAGAVSDVQGTPVAAMTSIFTLDSVAPRVIGSSVQENDVRAVAPTSTFTITFDEGMLAANLDASDFTLRGVNNAVNYTATSFSYNAAGTVLTLNYGALPEDRYTLTLLSASGRFEDAIGNDLDGEPVFPMPPGKSGNGTAGGNWVVNFDVDNTTAGMTTPMTMVNPAGSLAYETTASGMLNGAADTDTFTLPLDAGQVLTLLLAPTAFRSSLAVYDPTGNPIVSTTASSGGKPLLIQTLPVGVAGVYRFVISSADTAGGAYSLTATLNAAREAENYGGIGNDTPATAQDLGPALGTVTPGVSVGTVLGTIDNGFTSGFSTDFESGTVGWTVDNSVAGGLWHLSTGRGSNAGHSATHSFYFGTGETSTGGGTYSTGARAAGYLISPSITLPSASQISLGFNYLLQTENSTSWDKSIVQISTNGGTSWTDLASYNGVAESTVWRAASPISLAAYSGQTVKFRWSFDTVDGGANSYEGWYVDDVAVQFPSSATGDYFAVNLAAGERVSLLATTASAANITLALVDASGATLATAGAGTGGTSAAIDQFLVTSPGTYYVKVTGNVGANYTLVVDRNAATDREPNNTPATAQDITPSGAVVGNLSGGGLGPIASETFETGSLGPAWSTYSSTTSGRIQVTGQYTTAGGNYALLMDASTTVATLNEAIYTVDLSGQTQATLTFAHNDYNDEETAFLAGDFTGHQNADGIAVSADGGLTWRPIWTPPSSQGNTWTTYTLNLAQLAGNLPLGANFKIKFQQYDDNPLTTDGRGWDNITVSVPTPAEDYYAIDVDAGAVLTLTTATPGDGPYEFTNNLNPKLELFDAQGNLVASDDNGAADGKNARLLFTASAAGRYVVRVSAAGTAAGDYVLTSSSQPTDNPPPARPDLVAGSDTGLSSTDDITRLDNGSGSRALTFSIGQTTVGATVTLYADGVAIGSAVATSGTTLVTTDGATVLDDGTHVITARQTVPGDPQSIDSGALYVTIDASTPLTPLVPRLQAASDTGTVGDNVTADSTPTFDLGGVPAGHYFRFYRDGVRIGGNYDSGASFTPATTQADGTYAYTVSVVDAAGNESAQSVPVTVTIQTGAPVTPAGALDLRATSDSGISATDNVTSDNTPTFNLPAGVYAFRVYRNGARISGLFESGTSYTAPVQADGTADYTFTAVDAAGNESAASPALSVTIDTAAPVAPAAPDLQAASDTGVSSTDNLTADNTPTFDVGGIPAGHYFRFYRNGVLISGTFETGATFTTSPLPDGSAQYAVRVVDAAGNESAAGAALTVTVDTSVAAIAPDLQAASDSGASNSDNVTNDTTPTFDVPGAFAYRLFRDGVEVTPAGGITGPFTETAPLADGVYAYTAVTLDQAGNASAASAALSVTIDATAPAAPLAAPDLQAASDSGVSDSDDVTNDNTPTIDFGPLAAGLAFRLFRDGTALPGDLPAGPYTSPALIEGGHTFAVRAVDLAGNMSPLGAVLNIAVDTVAPPVGGAFGLDSTLNPGGSQPGSIIWNAGLTDRAAAVATLANGRILVAGSTTSPTTGRDSYVVSRRLANGEADTSFGVGGLATSPAFGPSSGYRAQARAMVVLPDGKILVVGDAERSDFATYKLGLARFNGDGSVDTSFGINGIVTFTFGGRPFLVRTALLQPDGKVLLGGELQADSTADGRDLALVRFTADAIPDGNFGIGGLVVKSLAPSFDFAGGLSLLPDGKILVGGTESTPTADAEQFVALRFKADGNVDNTYGTNGVALAVEHGAYHVAFGAVLQPDGKLVVAGSGYAGSISQFRATRFNADGSLDTSFGTNGFATTGMPASAMPFARDVALQPDGKILIVGGLSSGKQDVAFARFNPDGTPDTTLGAGGVTTFHFGPAANFDEARDITLTPEGQILFAGEVQVTGTGDYDFVLARLNLGLTLYAPDLQAASDTGASASDGVTADATPTLDVPLVPATYFRLYRNGMLVSGAYGVGDTYTLPSQADGTWTYTLGYVDAAGNESAAGAPLTVTIDTTAPTVSGAQLDAGLGRSLRIVFSEDVGPSLTPAAITLKNLTTGSTVPAGNLGVAFDPVTRTATVTFPGLGGGTLPDGNYRATIKAGGVADAAGTALAADYTYDFFVLGGDANRDGTVNFNDLLLLARNYNKTGSTYADGDFSGDGAVNFNDLLILARNYNKSLTGTPASSAPLDLQAALAAAQSAPALAPAPSTVASTTAPFAPTQIEEAPAPDPVPVSAVVATPAPVKKAKPVPVATAAPKPATRAPASVFGTRRIKRPAAERSLLA